MAWYPDAVRARVDHGSEDPPITPVMAILHVDAGNAYDLEEWFESGSGGIESHFHVRKDGSVQQFRSTGVEADANYHANSFWRDGRLVGAISVETQGYGDGTWNREQLAAITDLLTWCHTQHGIPLRVCPGPYADGVGYHVMFGAPGPWTPYAKTCPGPDRQRQFRDVLVPWMETGAPIDSEETDMLLTRGDQSEAVQQWQQFLIAYFKYRGVDVLTEWGADGVYGETTRDVTYRWQSEMGLPRGMVTPVDWAAMALALVRRDDPATVVDPGQHVRRDDRSLMDFAWLVRRDMAGLTSQVNRIAGGVGVDVDEQAIADRVVAALSPAKVADLVVKNLPASLAADVVDELNERLAA